MPPVVNSNIAIDSFPTLPISLGIVALFEQIYDGKPILTVFSNIGEDFTILLFQWSVWCEKCVAARHTVQYSAISLDQVLKVHVSFFIVSYSFILHTPFNPAKPIS